MSLQLLQSAVAEASHRLAALRVGEVGEEGEAAMGPATADVTVTCGQASLRLHSALLAAKSRFFAATFGTPMVEREHMEVTIKEVEPDIFKKVVAFIYEGELEFGVEEELADLLDAADRFDMEELKARIAEQVEPLVEVSNVVAVAVLATRYHAEGLAGRCVAFIQEHGVVVGEEELTESPGLATAIIGEYQTRKVAMEQKHKEEMEKMQVKLNEKEVKIVNLEELLAGVDDVIYSDMDGDMEDSDQDSDFWQP